jgi:hypothetical protein
VNRRGALAVAVLLAAAPIGCAEPRSEFMVRVAADCSAGDRAACHLLHAPPDPSAFSGLNDTQSGSRGLVQEDLEAMIRGMAQARSSPRFRPANGTR